MRRVAVGQSLLDPAVTARVLERLRKGSETDEQLAQLTDHERKILDLIADGLTNRQIAERVHLAEDGRPSIEPLLHDAVLLPLPLVTFVPGDTTP